MGLYAPQRGVTLFEEVRLLINGWLLLAAIWFAFLFLSKTGSDFSRVWSLYWMALGFVVHLAVRVAIRMMLRALRRRGYNVRRIAIVGAGALGREHRPAPAQAALERIRDPRLLRRQPGAARHAPEGLRVQGPVDQMLRDLDSESIDQVWIALPLRADKRIRELLDGLRAHSVEVRFVPDIFNFHAAPSLADRDRRPAGHQPDRIAAAGRQSGAEGARGLIVLACMLIAVSFAADAR